MPGVYLPPQRNATVADDAFSLLFISIHAPREGSDDLVNSLLGTTIRISIHAPREGSDVLISMMRSDIVRFQSTLPARGATGLWITWTATNNNFNPRSPRGERRYLHGCGRPVGGFQSTLPARGATCIIPRRQAHCLHFNPRSPRGERPVKVPLCLSESCVFQSTLPARGATAIIGGVSFGF